MKCLRWATLAVLLGLETVGAQEQPAAPAQEPAPIVKADGPVVIDGVLDEACWKNAVEFRADYLNSKKGVLSDEPRLKVKYTWDEHYLYIAYETFDKNLIAKGNGVTEGPEKNQRPGCEIWSPKEKVDVVEFFLSFGDERFFWEIHHNALNQFNDVWISVLDPNWPVAKSSMAAFGIIFSNQEYIHDEGEYTTAMAVKLKPKADGAPSTVNTPGDTDTGYIAELRFPWAGLGAPTAFSPNAKKNETGWNLANQQLMLLAVVQDGDLPERYHHSAPLRSGDWFHKTAALWPKYILTAPAKKGAENKPPAAVSGEQSTPELAAEILQRVDRNETVADLLQPAAERGMAMAREIAHGLNRDKPQRDAALYDVIATVSRCRSHHKDLLKLYDPVAHDIFYTDAGMADEKLFAYALESPSPKWGRDVPEALVNSAPRPLLAWLQIQARSATPDLPRLGLLWKHWGAHILLRREHQYVNAVQNVTALFAENAKIIQDSAALAGLVRFIGESGNAGLSDFVCKQLGHADAEVRIEAYRALEHFNSERAPEAVLAGAAKEQDSAVLVSLAEILGVWPDDSKTGAAALQLFQRCERPDVRRALLFSSIKATWPQRAELLLSSFQAPDQGVLGIALQAIAKQPEATSASQTAQLINNYKTPPAPLIDALGSLKEPQTAPYLADALKQASNLSIKIKLALALEKIGGVQAHAVLLDQLKHTADPLYAVQLAGIAGRIQLPGADEALIALAEDSTAPMPLRVQCIWSMGAYRTAAVKTSLKRMDSDIERYFGMTEPASRDISLFEKTEQARMLLKMSKLQMGAVEAASEAAELYRKGTPTTQFSMLMLLANLKMDHAVIREGLESGDFAVLLAAVHAAGAADPKKYHAKLLALSQAPYIKALLDTGLDLTGFPDTLSKVLALGQEHGP